MSGNGNTLSTDMPIRVQKETILPKRVKMMQQLGKVPPSFFSSFVYQDNLPWKATTAVG